MATKPSIPKGTRDFSPQEMLRRKYIFNTIEKVFQKYGFLPLETPAMENLETLTGKYGEEGDRLIFKILNSGDAWDGVSDNVKENIKAGEPVHPGRLASELAEKALRYDLTVPFARYVVQHQNEITFPFKRYQIQPVWRADRPQKGRYREFYQCDADVIGSTSMLNELDLVLIMKEVFERLNLEVVIKINNRKVLQGLAELFSVQDRMADFITTLDKYDKVGRVGVLEEYAKKGYEESFLSAMDSFLSDTESRDGRRASTALMDRFQQANSAIGVQGMLEMGQLMEGLAQTLKTDDGRIENDNVRHDLALARGLDYYTGAIFEVKAAEGSLQSSICGGGRYDDLTSIFGLKNVSGVGISFGADRIYDVLLELGRFPTDIVASTKLLMVAIGPDEMYPTMRMAHRLRQAGVAVEVSSAVHDKMKKVLGYANDKGIPFVAIIGENEMKQGIITVKDMKTGEQKAVKAEELIKAIN